MVDESFTVSVMIEEVDDLGGIEFELLYIPTIVTADVNCDWHCLQHAHGDTQPDRDSNTYGDSDAQSCSNGGSDRDAHGDTRCDGSSYGDADGDADIVSNA